MLGQYGSNRQALYMGRATLRESQGKISRVIDRTKENRRNLLKKITGQGCEIVWIEPRDWYAGVEFYLNRTPGGGIRATRI